MASQEIRGSVIPTPEELGRLLRERPHLGYILAGHANDQVEIQETAVLVSFEGPPELRISPGLAARLRGRHR